jgi:hypothetical protein
MKFLELLILKTGDVVKLQRSAGMIRNGYLRDLAADNLPMQAKETDEKDSPLNFPAAVTLRPN